MKNSVKLITSIVASSMLLIGLSTSLSSYSPLVLAATTGTTGTTTDGNNGSLIEGIPCTSVITYHEGSNYVIIRGSGFGTSCQLGGSGCNTDDYITVKNCLATSYSTTTLGSDPMTD